MKYGVLVFSYKNFGKTRLQFETDGIYTINLGDYMQTLAVRRMYREMGVADADVIEIDRDSITEYTGEPVILPMAACFYDWCFPLPENIHPVFIGFQAKEAVIKRHRAYFRKFAFMGCRDINTAKSFEKYGIPAVVTGCVTLTFTPRDHVPQTPRVLLVYGSGAGAFPGEVMPHIPRELLPHLEMVFQRKVVHSHPLSPGQMAEAEAHASWLLEGYRKRASLVITPLHHVAAPCMSAGIPVILVRKTPSIRFSYLETLIRVHRIADLGEIDWNAPMANIDSVREEWIRKFHMLAERLRHENA